MKHWRHVKRGTVYREIGRGIFQIAGDSSIADEEPVVIYAGEDGRMWVRPEAEFLDGRFEEVEPVPAEPEWVAWGTGWRLKGTNWTVQLIADVGLWDVVCGRKYLGASPMLDAAKHHAIELRRLMAEEPTP